MCTRHCLGFIDGNIHICFGLSIFYLLNFLFWWNFEVSKRDSQNRVCCTSFKKKLGINLHCKRSCCLLKWKGFAATISIVYLMLKKFKKEIERLRDKERKQWFLSVMSDSVFFLCPKWQSTLIILKAHSFIVCVASLGVEWNKQICRVLQAKFLCLGKSKFCWSPTLSYQAFS